MTNRIRKVTILSACLFGLFPIGANANTIFISNSGFEAPVVSATTYGSVPGWNAGNEAGVSPTSAGLFTAPQGNQVGFGGPQYGILIQDVGAVTGGATYTLSADVVASLMQDAYSYRLMIGYGGHDLATTNVFALTSGPVVLKGTFDLVSAMGIAPVGATGPLLIFLENSNAFGFGSYAGFDAVTLSSSVPEASTWAMMLLGFGGLAFAGYRRGRPQTASFAAA
jgi:PEP-CTERM motif